MGLLVTAARALADAINFLDGGQTPRNQVLNRAACCIDPSISRSPLSSSDSRMEEEAGKEASLLHSGIRGFVVGCPLEQYRE